MSKFTKKVASAGLSLTTVVWLTGATLIPVASAQSVADLQSQIAALLAQINALQAQLTTTSGGSSVATACSFTRDLTVGSKGEDVKCLQQYLNATGNTIASSGAGSPGNETTYFGGLTKAAVAKWQAANSLTPPAGYFGAKSRAKYSAIGGSTGSTGSPGVTTPVVTVPAGTDLVVSLAGDTPATKTLGSGTAFNPSAKINLTAGGKSVKITAIKVSKNGFLANTNLNGVDIVDSKGTRHGNVVTSVNADNTVLITMTTDPITVSAGSTETITIRFNLLTGNYNASVSFGIAKAADITADSSAISGSFPITGKEMNIVNGGTSLASATLDVLTTTGSSTLTINPDSQQEITRLRVQETSSNEGVYLYSVALYNYDSAADTDYTGVTLTAIDGTVLATANPSGKTVTLKLDSPYLIDKGVTKDFIVKAKIVNGSDRKINLAVFNNYDIDLRGSTSGVSVIPGAGSNDSSFPIGNGFNIQTVGKGTLTLTKATDSPSAATTPGSQNVVLAKYKMKPNGENMELRKVSFYIDERSGSADGTNLTGTVFVNVNGSTVYSVGASSISTTTASTITLSSYPILEQSKDSIIEVVASISTSGNSNDSYTVQNMDIIEVKRLVTNDLVDPSVGTVDGNQISVKAAALAVTTLSTPIANSVVVGTNQHVFSTIQLNAQSGGEDVKVSQIVIDSVEANYTEVSNLYLYKDSETSPLSTTNSTASNADTITFSFVTPILVKRDTPVTLHLKGDVVSGSNAHTFRVTSSTSAVTAVGASSGNSLTSGSDTTYAGNGQAQTVTASGKLTLSVLSGTNSSPSINQLVSVNTTDLPVFAFKLKSDYEPIKISSLKLTATTTSGLTLTATTTLKNIKVREGSITGKVVASAPQFDVCSASLCTITFTASDNIFTDPVPTAGLSLYVTADVAAGGQSRLGDSFNFTIASTTGDITAKGSVSAVAATGTNLTGTATAPGVTFVVPQKVTISANSLTTTVGTAAGATTGSFKLTNSGGVAIYLATSTAFTITNSGSGSSTTSTGGLFTLYGSNQGATDQTITLATSTVGTTVGSSTIVMNIGSSSATEAQRQIDGGNYRTLTVKNNAAFDNNNTMRLSVGALGDFRFYVKESELGYDANLDGDTSDTIGGLYIDGLPAHDTVTFKT